MSATPYRILYLGDPGSIHDLKWMCLERTQAQRFLVLRKCHAQARGADWLNDWSTRHGVTVLGDIEDFSLVRFWKTLVQAYQLRRLIREHNIDFLHIFFAEPNALWAWFGKWLGCPVVVTTRGTDVLKTIPRFFQAKDPLSLLVSKLYRRAFQQVRLITSTSQSQAEAVDSIAPGRGRDVQLIRTGVDIGQLQRHCEQTPTLAPTDKPYILFPRIMTPIYQHEFALEALKLLSPSLRKDYRYIFLGKDGPDPDYVDGIRALMSEVDAEILFWDTLDLPKLHSAISKAALVVMTPRSDGASVTAAETLLCRVPLLLPPLNYDSDLFGEAFFFEEWKHQVLADKIEEVLSGSWSERLERAHHDVAMRFDRSKEMERLWVYYGALS